MIDNKTLAIAISIAADAFKSELDKGGNPYILHCLAVMYGVEHLGTDAMIVGVLHDVVEDTSISYKDLEELGIPYHIMGWLSNVTKLKGEVYMEYVRRCASHPISKAVKIADLEHNMKASRMVGLRKKDFDRLEKYHIAYMYLKD